jgi:hypothetical protein
MTNESPTASEAPTGKSRRPGASDVPKRGVIFLPDRNQVRSDYVGAFDPESRAFSEMYKIPRVKIDISRGGASRRTTVLHALKDLRGLDVVAFFMHGLRSSLPGSGFDKSNARQLGEALNRALSSEGVVVLYACSTAGGVGGGERGEGGFADALRDVLSERDGWKGHVDAHERAAHTTKNSLCRRFFANPEGKSTGVGAEWIVEPGTPLFAAWKRNELHGSDGMRFRFPFMSIEQIREETARDSGKAVKP